MKNDKLVKKDYETKKVKKHYDIAEIPAKIWEKSSHFVL